MPNSYCVWITLIIFLSACKVKNDGRAPEWSKNLSIYEIMPKQYSEKKNFSGIIDDLDRIHSMFFNAICLLPIQERDESNNAFNPNSPFAIKDFIHIDPDLGNSQQLNTLIDSAHAKNIKVLIEWNFSGTGPHHKWRLKKPEYYMSDQKMINNRYNQDYVRFKLSNNSLQKELLSAIKVFLKRNRFDGVVFYNLDQMHESFIEDLIDLLNSIRPLLIINHSNTFLAKCHFNVNNSLYSRFEQSYAGDLKISEFDKMLDTVCRYPVVNYVQDYIKNEKYGSDVSAFYNAYRYYHSLTYFLPGIPWVLNGQEDPQFERINLFSNKPFLRKFKYNNDFYRSLNLLKQNNPALWNNDPGNLPIKISDSNEVLALERSSGKHSCVGIFNLTDRPVIYSIFKDYHFYYDAFNKVQLSLIKNEPLNLGPFQSIIITNSP